MAVEQTNTASLDPFYTHAKAAFGQNNNVADFCSTMEVLVVSASNVPLDDYTMLDLKQRINLDVSSVIIQSTPSDSASEGNF